MWKQSGNKFTFTGECGTVVVVEKRRGVRGWKACFEQVPKITTSGKTGTEALTRLVSEFQGAADSVSSVGSGELDKLNRAARSAAASWLVVPV